MKAFSIVWRKDVIYRRMPPILNEPTLVKTNTHQKSWYIPKRENFSSYAKLKLLCYCCVLQTSLSVWIVVAYGLSVSGGFGNTHRS